MGLSRIRLYQIGVLVGLVLLLEALCLAGIIDKITMPPPHRIAIDFVKLMLSGQLYPEIGKSLLNVFIAWVTAFAVGIASLSQFDPGIDLTGVGMPGCNLHVSLDVTTFSPVVGGAAQWVLPIPADDPSWYGLQIYWQWAVGDAGLNGLSLSLSNAAGTTVGG